MKSSIIKYGLLLLLMLSPFIGLCQWENGQVSVFFKIPEIALIDIEPGLDNSIHFSVLPATESGESPTIEQPSNEYLWLNYSSALSASHNSRLITAEVTQGTIPPGISIFLKASEYAGSGKGKRGQPAGKIELTNQPRPIITGIGNCFTGDGIQMGHQLEFSVEISDYAHIESAGETNFIILYTLTDN